MLESANSGSEAAYDIADPWVVVSTALRAFAEGVELKELVLATEEAVPSDYAGASSTRSYLLLFSPAATMAQALDFDTFLAKYVDTNIPPGAPRYDRATLEGLLHNLIVRTGPSVIDFHILVSRQPTLRGESQLISFIQAAQCCALKRGDLVPHLFRDKFGGRPQDEIFQAFCKVRETLNVIWPFIGVPQIVPACLGLAGYLQSLNLADLLKSDQRSR